VEEVFKIIANSAQGESIPREGKIEKITQAMEAYKVHIGDLMDLLTPTITPDVRTHREQEATSHLESISLSIQEIIEVYNKSARLWIDLQEDGKLRELDQKEEGTVNKMLQELKKN